MLCAALLTAVGAAVLLGPLGFIVVSSCGVGDVVSDADETLSRGDRPPPPPKLPLLLLRFLPLRLFVLWIAATAPVLPQHSDHRSISSPSACKREYGGGGSVDLYVYVCFVYTDDPII